MTKTTPRTLPLAKLDDTQDTRDIADCTQVYGDIEVDDFGTVIEPCILSPSGQCQYDHHDGFENCVHCGKGDGV